MTFRKLLIILTITVTALVITLLGTSYAWYQFDNAVTRFDNVRTFGDDIDLAVVFTNSDNISTTVGVPLLVTQIDQYSSKTNFTMTPSSAVLSGKEVAFQISLVDLVIDPSLTAVEDLKYSLIEKIGDGTSQEVASGNFKGLTSSSITLMNKEISALDVTYSYEFRIWLQDNGCTLEQINNNVCSSQNSLMGKQISGRVRVSSAFK